VTRKLSVSLGVFQSAASCRVTVTRQVLVTHIDDSDSCSPNTTEATSSPKAERDQICPHIKLLLDLLTTLQASLSWPRRVGTAMSPV
jgi:hypothetical protein